MNRLTNAGGLELTYGWAASTGLTVGIDETTLGSPGRCALTAIGASPAAGFQTLQPANPVRATVTAGETIEISAGVLTRVAGLDAKPDVRVVFRNGDGTQAGVEPVAVTPPPLLSHGVGKGGLRETYWRAYGRLTVPPTAIKATLEARASASAAGQAIVIALLKPFLDAVPTGRAIPLAWDPGRHGDDDLDLPTWPQTLRPFQAQQGGEPQTATVDFGEGAGRPQQRPTASDPARKLSGRMRCDAVERDTLEAFWRNTRGDFWFVEPDTDRLCVASFAADGAPRAAEVRGPTTMMDVVLWLETA